MQTFFQLRIIKIVFRDSSLYPKQLSLFCLLWLSSASAVRIGCVGGVPVPMHPLDLKNFRKNIVFFVSSGKNEISPLLAPSTKILKNTLVSPTLEKSFPWQRQLLK